jgi:hypothetical protein
MYLTIASAFGMPHVALHVAIFALLAKEDNNNDLLSSPLVADNGSVDRMSSDTSC